MSLEKCLKKIPTGTRIIREGEPVNGFYFLKEGEMKFETGNIAKTIPKGHLIGEVGYYFGGKRTGTVTAKTDCEAYFFKDIETLYGAVCKNPDLMNNLENQYKFRANETKIIAEKNYNNFEKLFKKLLEIKEEIGMYKDKNQLLKNLFSYLSKNRVDSYFQPIKESIGDFAEPIQPQKLKQYYSFDNWMRSWCTKIILEDNKLQDKISNYEKLRNTGSTLLCSLRECQKEYHNSWIKNRIDQLERFNLPVVDYDNAIELTKCNVEE